MTAVSPTAGQQKLLACLEREEACIYSEMLGVVGQSTVRSCMAHGWIRAAGDGLSQWVYELTDAGRDVLAHHLTGSGSP